MCMRAFLITSLTTFIFAACNSSTIVDSYVAQFNASDEEIYIQEYDNSEAAQFLLEISRYSNVRTRNWKRPIISVGGPIESIYCRLRKDM